MCINQNKQIVALIVWFMSIHQASFAQPNCKTQQYDLASKSVKQAPIGHEFGIIDSNYYQVNKYAYYRPRALMFGQRYLHAMVVDTLDTDNGWYYAPLFSCQSVEHGGGFMDSQYILTIYSRDVLFIQRDTNLPHPKVARILYLERISQIDKVERFQYGTDQFFLVYSPIKSEYELSGYSRPECVEQSSLYVFRLSEDYTFTKMLEEIVSTMSSDRSECIGLVEPRTKGNYFVEGGEQFKIHFSFSTTRPVKTPNYEKRFVYDPEENKMVLEYTNFQE